MFLGLLGIGLQRGWPTVIYPWLSQHGHVKAVGNVLATLSKPFNPIIVWEMNANRCPINSYEISLITMILSLLLYCLVSYVTGLGKEKFNLDRMLHRGIYAIDGEKKIKMEWSFKNVLSKMIGITPEYTFGDRCIAHGLFIYSIIYRFFLLFIVVIIWNAIKCWSSGMWSWYFAITALIVPGIVAAITTVWFGVGGIKDMIQLFRDLKARTEVSKLDNGWVEGGISVADKDKFAQIEKENEEKGGK